MPHPVQVLQIKKEEESQKKREEAEERARMLKEQERVRKDREREMRLKARQDEEVKAPFIFASLSRVSTAFCLLLSAMSCIGMTHPVCTYGCCRRAMQMYAKLKTRRTSAPAASLWKVCAASCTMLGSSPIYLNIPQLTCMSGCHRRGC